METLYVQGSEANPEVVSSLPPCLPPSPSPPLPLLSPSSLLHALQHSNRLLSYTPPREAGSLG